ncbi:type II toxin-antitoxin system HipA family toxin [Methylobacterium sp. 092160098-2]|jgi:serine/threonine-protein kinase HipA|uniref:type II toxin-antitoxin system HipA family toxin n=1 Tax=Methylobacterium sp. 092160098-2 TaxID=3025129 RepID=UPI002381AB0F|nr:type II toxin-antitoxin system HipA family toxin [Methylobacterium sp. 092160098-2]MDE4914624.1 type II toxin-antitoxin system HipA family toxin [Methylobacterium sp. 092160098-2]
MTSRRPKAFREVFVWIWLPAAVEPVVAGRIAREGELFVFNYGRSYLSRPDRRPIYLSELPLKPGAIAPEAPLEIAGCLRDGSPDAWGRRVIVNRLTGLAADDAGAFDLDEITFMLASGSDRAGSLDFQASPSVYVSREPTGATLDDLSEAAARVERGEPIPPALDRALLHCSSIGGSRPKALIGQSARKFIAKFSATNDTYAVVKAEYVAMRLARLAGLNAAPVELASAGGKDVLLVERFDRAWTPAGWTRRSAVSALTIFGLGEMQAHYASYSDLADIVRARFASARRTLRELFARMVFNVLVGNNDDHARNHAAFWDGEKLELTPAYDICPQARGGRETNQAIFIVGADRRSLLETCRTAAPRFHLRDREARDVVEEQVDCIRREWRNVCDEAALSEVDRSFLWRRQFLNDYAFEGFAGGTPAGL